MSTGLRCKVWKTCWAFCRGLRRQLSCSLLDLSVFRNKSLKFLLWIQLTVDLKLSRLILFFQLAFLFAPCLSQGMSRDTCGKLGD